MASNVPKPETIRALKESGEAGKVVMVNLLKFKAAAGVASYTEYVRRVIAILERIRAKIVFAGPVTSAVIGEQSWDSILLVEYPSREVFVEMITSPEYQAIHHFRDDALERSELYAVSPDGGFMADAIWQS